MHTYKSIYKKQVHKVRFQNCLYLLKIKSRILCHELSKILKDNLQGLFGEKYYTLIRCQVCEGIFA